MAAARILEKHLKSSALKPEAVLSELLQCRAYARYEFDNPVRSFKIRGALNLLHHLTAGPAATPTNLVTASTGNHGAAMAFACQQYGVPLTVGVPVGCDQSKVGLIRQFEANLEFLGRDMDETKELLTDAYPKRVSSSRMDQAPRSMTAHPRSGWRLRNHYRRWRLCSCLSGTVP